MSKGVDLKVAIETKYIYLHTFHFQIFIHISVNIILKSCYVPIVKYVYD